MYLIVALLLLMLFAVITICYRKNYSLSVDNRISIWVSEHRTSFMTSMMYAFSWIGGPMGTLIVGVLFLLINPLRQYYFIPLVLAGAISALINRVLKESFDRDRPIYEQLVMEKGFSFPSGHSMVNASLYSLVCFLTYYHRFENIQFIVLIFTIVMIIGIGISRIYLGVHYFTDVVAGWSLGIAITLLYMTMVNLHWIPQFPLF